MESSLKAIGETTVQIIDGDRGDHYPKKAEFHKKGFCLFLSTSNVTTTGFDFESTEFITREKDALLRKGKLLRNDIVMTTRGTVGNSAFYGYSIPYENVRINSGMVIFRTVEDELDPYYLYCFLRSELFEKQTLNHGSGSAQPQLPIASLRNIKIPVPRPSTQKAISKVLSTLDAKIELNNRINDELEGLAKLLYDYWFVQFDFPISAEQAAAMGNPQLQGKPYRQSGGKMVYNETLKREIPEGWEDGTLSEFCTMKRGVTYGKNDVLPSSYSNASPVLRATNVTGSILDLHDMVYVHQRMVNEDQYLQLHDNLVVMSSGSKDHVGKNAPMYHEESVAFGAFCSKVTPAPKARAFIKVFLQSAYYRKFIRNVSLGTNINNLTDEHVIGQKLPTPPDGILSQFEAVLQPAFEKIGNNHRQNQYLTELRDWLLPMLMNGQVTVG